MTEKTVSKQRVNMVMMAPSDIAACVLGVAVGGVIVEFLDGSVEAAHGLVERVDAGSGWNVFT